MGRANKQSKRYEYIIDTQPEFDEPEYKTDSKSDCPKCQKEIVPLDFSKRVILICQACGYKKSRAK